MNRSVLITHVGDASILLSDMAIGAIAAEESLTYEGLLSDLGAVVLCAGNADHPAWAIASAIELGDAVTVVKVGRNGSR